VRDRRRARQQGRWTEEKVEEEEEEEEGGHGPVLELLRAIVLARSTPEREGVG
jgi:hypothetical protein